MSGPCTLQVPHYDGVVHYIHEATYVSIPLIRTLAPP